MEYLPVDSLLASDVILVFADDKGQGVLNPNSEKRKAYKVDFQFPPKITSDSKSGDWDETANNIAFSEPFGVFKGSKPRTISLKWNYIVDSSGEGTGNSWTTKRIATITQALRGYFGRMDNAFGNLSFNPTIVYFKMYRHQYSLQKFRIDNVDVSYSENLIVPKNDDNRKYGFVVDANEGNIDVRLQAFPLKTDISLTLKPYPRGALRLADIEDPLEAAGKMSREWF